MNMAYLSLGSNMGRRMGNLNKALKLLVECGLKLEEISNIYQTEAVSKVSQPDFLNICVKVSTQHDSSKLLQICLLVESEVGRKRLRPKRQGYELPRTIDIDILLFNQLVMRTVRLIIPHEKMHERKFVLQPLAEIAPDVIHPVMKKTVKQLLKNCADSSIVKQQGKITTKKL